MVGGMGSRICRWPTLWSEEWRGQCHIRIARRWHSGRALPGAAAIRHGRSTGRAERRKPLQPRRGRWTRCHPKVIVICLLAGHRRDLTPSGRIFMTAYIFIKIEGHRSKRRLSNLLECALQCGATARSFARWQLPKRSVTADQTMATVILIL
eukprot:scaffold185172_cov30-Tisochrysis_lutea.AAC.2